MALTTDALPDQAAVRALSVLPDDAVLVHIGAPKTGTTALQGDLRRYRRRLAKHGVTFPATQPSQNQAGRFLVGGELGWDATRTPQERSTAWQGFADQVTAHPGRVLISSEFICEADDKRAERLVETLGGSRVHVIVAFRPLASLLPSSWQQYLKAGSDLPYDTWLSAVLADPPDLTTTPTFWKRNDVGAQLRRWSALVGAGKVTAVVIEGGADMKVRRAIEVSLALPAGLLSPPTKPKREPRSNRSMTVAEAELLRQVNVIARSSLSSEDYLSLVRTGAVRRMVESRTPGPDESRLALPEWAVPRITEISARQADSLVASGVRVVGDPGTLAEVAMKDTRGVRDDLPTEAAVLALTGVLDAAARRPAAPADELSLRTPSAGARRLNTLRRPARWAMSNRHVRRLVRR